MAAVVIGCLIVIVLLLSVAATGAKTATPKPTPLPSGNNTTATPTPREVLSSAGWDNDHAYVQVVNNGPAIDVEASIGSLANKTTTHVPANTSTRVPTMAVSAANGQVIRCWFRAYQNGTLIDSMDNVPVTVTTATTPTPAAASPTPGPETAIVSGTVVDATTGQPIAGAEVTFVPEDFARNYPPVTTGSSGEFTTMVKMSPGTYYLTVQANGYEQKTVTAPLIDGPQKISDLIRLERSQAVATPTPSPTPGFVDSWINMLSSPQACVSFVAVGLGAIVSATVLYEWVLRQRERRRRDEEIKGPGKPEDQKKP